MTVDRLVLREQHLGAILDHVQREWPNEACGLLAGRKGEIEQVYVMDNIRRSPLEYQMDPEQQVRAMLDIEQAGWELSAIFHSHPSGPAVPSTTDVARAYYPEAVYVIVARELDGQWGVRGFTIDGGQVNEIMIDVA